MKTIAKLVAQRKDARIRALEEQFTGLAAGRADADKAAEAAKRQARHDYYTAEAMSALILATTVDITPFWRRVLRYLGLHRCNFAASYCPPVIAQARAFADEALRQRDEPAK